MKVLVDMNLTPRWVRFLVASGHEALRWSEVGSADAEDGELLTWAAEQGYLVLTHDQDFNSLLAYTRHGKPSVVLLRTSTLRLEKTGERVLKALEATREDLMAEPGAVLIIEDQRMRIRRLPIW